MAGNGVTVEYLSRNQCRLHGDRDTLFLIQEAFAYFAKDYKHMPLYKRGIWDGRVFMFKVTDCILPAGLVWSLKQLALRVGFDVEVVPSKFSETVPFDDDFFLAKIAPLCQYEIMDHQLGSIQDVLVSNRRLVLSPTSSGKSLILYLCSRYIMEMHKKRVLIIVPNTTLVNQMREDFTEYSTDGWGGEKDVHGIYAEQEMWTTHDVVVSTYQSAVKFAKEWYEQFGAVFIDEAHGATSKSITTILANCEHMDYAAGFTGTLNGTYMHEIEMRARFGEVTQLVSTRQLMDMGIVAKLSIDAVTLSYPADVAKASSKWSYQDEIEFIVTNEARNNFLANLATTTDRNVMILFNRVNHGKELKRLIEERMGNKKLFYVDGNVALKDRAPIRAYMEANDDAILLASFGTSSVGLSIKNILTVILGHPFKDRIRVLQTIGRGLRKSATKSSVKVVDVGDHVCGKRKKLNATYEHFLARLALYQEEGFDYEVVTLDGVV